MRNSPTSVGSRAADTRSTVRACPAQGHSIVASSFNFTLLAGVFRNPRRRHATEAIRRSVSVFLRAHKISRSAVALDYRRGARARQGGGGRGDGLFILESGGCRSSPRRRRGHGGFTEGFKSL